MKRHWTVALLAFALSLSSGLSQSFIINWSTLDGGGGASTGGSFTLNGTVGQPDAGPPMSGGSFSISGGFWTASVAGPPPALLIRLAGRNAVILSWPNPSTGYVLQQTANMSAPGGGWVDVPQAPVVNGANKEVTLPATGRFCLFRLRRLSQ